ncbi:uncharacterized protein LOC122404320 [Colletes gigas]|uniref:uncharacterized protein LOC122404320 n=1 Tax=Colletes gigas TaxID=935657 RepID=UPI001C9B72F6|nr:uncharacterized protein LOC122404320 [Colletes gigas]XP_043264189.1 uncharacterized protein LOC122404320 [Colletes gigas]
MLKRKTSIDGYRKFHVVKLGAGVDQKFSGAAVEVIVGQGDGNIAPVDGVPLEFKGGFPLVVDLLSRRPASRKMFGIGDGLVRDVLQMFRSAVMLDSLPFRNLVQWRSSLRVELRRKFNRDGEQGACDNGGGLHGRRNHPSPVFTRALRETVRKPKGERMH